MIFEPEHVPAQTIAPPVSERSRNPCQSPTCSCLCHNTDRLLPPAETRWYCVVVGRNPGVVQGRMEAVRNYIYISGGVGRYCETEQEAKEEFQKSLVRGEVIKVTPPNRQILVESNIPLLPGFHNSDTNEPHDASWVAILVGRNPGLFCLATLNNDIESPTIQGNVQHIKGAHYEVFTSRPQAEKRFLTLLRAGNVEAVDRGHDLRVQLTTETYSTHV